MASSGGSPAIKALEDEISAIQKAQEPTRAKIIAIHEEAATKANALEAELDEGAAIIARNRAAIDLLTGKTRIGSAPRARRSPRSSVSAEGREDKIVEVLGQNPDGMNGVQLAEAIGVSAATARKTLDAMVAAKTIERTGEKRGTKYLPA